MSGSLKTIAAAHCAIFATGCLWAVGSTVFFPWTEIDVHAGKKLFHDRCASCHAVDSLAGDSLGPNLANVGFEAADRKPGLSAEEYLLQSITSPGAFRKPGSTGEMPADISAELSPADILSMVGYLQTLGSEPDAQHLVELLPQAQPSQQAGSFELDFSKAQRGKELFFNKGQCSSCHPLRDLPGNTLAAPALLRASVHSQEYLRQSILDPHHQIAAGYRLVQVLLTSGKAVVGRLDSQTDSEIQLLGITPDRPGLQTISRADIESEEGQPAIFELAQSSMPVGYGQTLSAEEIDALVHFLNTLPQ